ncbi:leucyl aminopeptidase [Methylotuvimicrobium alcaliphilum]|uniref:Probable cytosol aminopeptidase n=1 Tax=Methylotuvimicrobium alcaliphilum (strain DSM 19304 / NCIMB 14124 / VKM B-2133 / 20Z) TaxID=1091494 RepID=G4T0U0_META2|nr:leucyl aminopeptidase [Methylotuvimicrobium alcaliphilum]CCE22370.1 Cytosol aminopeptidase (Leucine aminopeptidase) (LAP) (Leucyl aminopeptidase) [Methylotuvimicrobium alcaliphilum 20Z]
MDYSIESLPLDKLQTDCIIVGLYENLALTASASHINQGSQNLISRFIERGDCKGKVGETALINWLPDTSFARVLLVGLGKSEEMNGKNYRNALAAAIKTVRDSGLKSAACTLAEIDVKDRDLAWKTRQVIEVFDDALYQFKHCKTILENEFKTDRISIVVSENQQAEARTGLVQGQAIAGGVSLAKQLADLPGNICTPTYLAEQAQSIAERFTSMSVDILEEADMEKLGMGALLSVSRGSRQPAKLIALNYQGGEKNGKPIVLIGKGLTFDAGGISLKPGLGMDEMKYDMCGGASVLGTLQAAAEMQLPLNIVGLVPSSENLPDGDANKPGDIVTSMSGKTIEILNTDAEGRLLLCDTLTYAQKFDPDTVIDMATLTGACIVALGRVPSGLFGNDDALCNGLVKAGETASDSVWRLPLWEEYQELLKSNFADMANIGGKDAGTITAACFLSKFAENFRWAHLDIAGTAWRTGLTKGATGRPVPLLAQYLLDRCRA